MVCSLDLNFIVIGQNTIDMSESNQSVHGFPSFTVIQQSIIYMLIHCPNSWVHTFPSFIARRPFPVYIGDHLRSCTDLTNKATDECWFDITLPQVKQFPIFFFAVNRNQTNLLNKPYRNCPPASLFDSFESTKWCYLQGLLYALRTYTFDFQEHRFLPSPLIQPAVRTLPQP